MRSPLSQKITDIRPSGIRKFFDIVTEMQDAISLGVGEPDFDTPWRIRQEFIEICNALDADPYTQDDAGSVVMAVTDAQTAVRCLEDRGVPAAVIGRMTQACARVIMRGGTRCYINKDAHEAFGEERS